MAATNVQAFPGDVEIANNLTVSDAIIADNGTKHSLTIDASSSLIYNKVLTFTSISADSYNYVGRFSVYAPPAIFSISDSGTNLGSGSRYSMTKQWGSTKPIMNALEGSLFTGYTFVWQANGVESYDVWFKPGRAGSYTVYVHAKDYTFPTAPGSPTYLDVLYGLVNLSDDNGGLAHAIIGAPGAYGNASLQLFNNGQTTNNRLTHEAIQLFSNTTPATGDISNVYITMTPSTTNNGYGGYIEGWIKSGTASGLTIGSINQGTKHAGITVVGAAANVGIGTTAPLAGLDVRSGDGTESDTHATFGKAVAASAGWSGIRLGTPYAAAHDAYCSVIESYNDHNANFASILRFKTHEPNDAALATERMRIDSGGKVGIGTDVPTGQLEVHGDGQTSETTFNQAGLMGGVLALRSDDGTTGSGGAVMFGTNAGFHAAIKASLEDGSTNTRGRLAFFTRTNHNDATMSHVMTIADGGNVGIGTTNPVQKLQVDGGTQLNGYTKIDNTGTVLGLYPGSGSNFFFKGGGGNAGDVWNASGISMNDVNSGGGSVLFFVNGNAGAGDDTHSAFYVIRKAYAGSNWTQTTTTVKEVVKLAGGSINNTVTFREVSNLLEWKCHTGGNIHYYAIELEG